MKKRLHEIIRDLQEVIVESDLKISNECLFEQSCTFLRGEIANENRHTKLVFQEPKEKGFGKSELALKIANTPIFPVKSSQVGNSDSFGKKEPSNTSESDKPTEKQLAFLKRNGVKISPKLTKDEAKIMINTFLQNLERRNV